MVSSAQEEVVVCTYSGRIIGLTREPLVDQAISQEVTVTVMHTAVSLEKVLCLHLPVSPPPPPPPSLSLCVHPLILTLPPPLSGAGKAGGPEAGGGGSGGTSGCSQGAVPADSILCQGEDGGALSSPSVPHQ